MFCVGEVGGVTHGGILKLKNSVLLFWNRRPTARTIDKWRLNAVVAEAKGKRLLLRWPKSKKRGLFRVTKRVLNSVISLTWGSVRLWGMSGKSLKRGFRRAIRGNVCTV